MQACVARRAVTVQSVDLDSFSDLIWLNQAVSRSLWFVIQIGPRSSVWLNQAICIKVGQPHRRDIALAIWLQ